MTEGTEDDRKIETESEREGIKNKKQARKREIPWSSQWASTPVLLPALLNPSSRGIRRACGSIGVRRTPATTSPVSHSSDNHRGGMEVEVGVQLARGAHIDPRQLQPQPPSLPVFCSPVSVEDDKQRGLRLDLSLSPRPCLHHRPVQLAKAPQERKARKGPYVAALSRCGFGCTVPRCWRAHQSEGTRVAFGI